MVTFWAPLEKLGYFLIYNLVTLQSEASQSILSFFWWRFFYVNYYSIWLLNYPCTVKSV